jgi:hypothetical protein
MGRLSGGANDGKVIRHFGRPFVASLDVPCLPVSRTGHKYLNRLCIAVVYCITRAASRRLYRSQERTKHISLLALQSPTPSLHPASRQSNAPSHPSPSPSPTLPPPLHYAQPHTHLHHALPFREPRTQHSPSVHSPAHQPMPSPARRAKTLHSPLLPHHPASARTASPRLVDQGTAGRTLPLGAVDLEVVRSVARRRMAVRTRFEGRKGLVVAAGKRLLYIVRRVHGRWRGRVTGGSRTWRWRGIESTDGQGQR